MPRLATDTPQWFQFLGAPRDDTDERWAFSDAKTTHSRPLVARAPITILPGFGTDDPGVRSFDEPFLNFLRKLVDNLNTEFAVDLDNEDYVGASGIHQNFDRCKTVAGYSMSPMSLAPVDNAPFVKSLGLPSRFRSARHAAIFDKLARLTMGSWVVSSVKTAKLSTSGAPVWSSNAAYKREHAVFILKNHERIRGLWDKRDLVGLAAYAKVVFLMNAGRRDQVDAVGKPRWVFPLDYALSGGRAGAPVAADKSVVLPDGRSYSDFSATRARLFHGAPFATNLMPQVIATGTLHGLFHNFAPTFHCTDVEALADGIAVTEKIACSDATEYDRSMATFLIKRLFLIAREYWDDSWVDWAEQLAFCAYFSRPVGLKDKGYESKSQLIGEVFAKGHQIFRGNPSGHAWTSLIAKFMMVFDFLATADDLTHDCLERMEDYLLHKMPLKTHNNGDDGMYRGETALLDKYTAYRFGENNPGYFSLKREEGHVWSGYIMAPKKGGGYRAYHRIHTTIEKMFCPERSAGSNFRPRFTIGLLQRLNGGTHPKHDLVIEMIARTWREEASPFYGDLMDIINRHHERLTIDTLALTRIDREVLDDPTKLYHLYSEDDVSPTVLAMIFEKAISVEEVMPFVTRAFKGNILDPNNRASNDALFDKAA